MYYTLHIKLCMNSLFTSNIKSCTHYIFKFCHWEKLNSDIIDCTDETRKISQNKQICSSTASAWYINFMGVI